MEQTLGAWEQFVKKQQAYVAHGTTAPYEFRVQQLKKLYALIQANEKALAKALYQDLGKCSMESYMTETGFVLAEISYTLRHLKQWMKPQKAHMPMHMFPLKGEVCPQPYGSVLIIGPFNYPLQLLFVPLISAIAAGNSCVLVPSEQAAHTAQLIQALLTEHFPSAYIFCTDGRLATTQALLTLSFDYIFFTGSERVGKIVMEQAAKHLIPLTLELGGKSPVIMGRSARVQACCERIIWGKLLNAGQTCVAPDYLLVPEEMMDSVQQALQESIVRMVSKDPQQSASFGRIIHSTHVQRLNNILTADRKYVVFGGEVVEEARYVAPTLLRLQDMHAACMQEELFGPLLPLVPYKQLEDALAIIHTKAKPLALYIMSEDQTEIQTILAKTSSGGVCINDTISHMTTPTLPFGSIGASGMGQYHGYYGFTTFSHMRSVARKTTCFTLRMTYPPYREKTEAMLRKLFK